MNLYFGKKEIHTQRTQTLYVVSNGFQSKKALNAYKRRWGIEVVFGHFKKKGLNIEDTHLRLTITAVVFLETFALMFLALNYVFAAFP